MFPKGLLWQAKCQKLGVQGSRLPQCPWAYLAREGAYCTVGTQGWKQSYGGQDLYRPQLATQQSSLLSGGLSGSFSLINESLVLKGLAVGGFFVSSGCWGLRTVGKAVGILDYF